MPAVDALTDLANARVTFTSASAPGVGFTLRRARLEKVSGMSQRLTFHPTDTTCVTAKL